MSRMWQTEHMSFHRMALLNRTPVLMGHFMTCTRRIRKRAKETRRNPLLEPWHCVMMISWFAAFSYYSNTSMRWRTRSFDGKIPLDHHSLRLSSTLSFTSFLDITYRAFGVAVLFGQ
jgi:hypothetical protein